METTEAQSQERKAAVIHGPKWSLGEWLKRIPLAYKLAKRGMVVKAFDVQDRPMPLVNIPIPRVKGEPMMLRPGDSVVVFVVRALTPRGMKVW